MEFTAPGAGDMSVFKQLPRGHRDRPGLRELPARADRLGRHDRRARRDGAEAPRRRRGSRSTPTAASPPARAAEVSIDEVYTKLKNEVEAARRLREKYG